MFPQIKSSAIEAIKAGTEAGQVDVTFSGNRTYTYSVEDVTAFASAVTEVVTGNESVGRFVNKSLRNGTLNAIS